MNLEKSSLILLLVGVVGGLVKGGLSTVNRLPSGRLPVCLLVWLFLCHFPAQCIHITYVPTQGYRYNPLRLHTPRESEVKGVGRERDWGRQLSQWQCLLFAVCSSLPRVASYWVLPKTHLIISFCHNNRKYDFRSQSQSAGPGPWPLPGEQQRHMFICVWLYLRVWGTECAYENADEHSDRDLVGDFWLRMGMGEWWNGE